MKLSGYHKANGDRVTLKLDYDSFGRYDKVYIAKVFTDTPIPDGGLFGSVLDLPNVEYGGTGFYYDTAPALPARIEHSMPDYHLYDDWIGEGAEFKAYRDYSIGFLTRGCFRHCAFCVNRRANRVVAHSPLVEFLDVDRKKICLLDDNFFGYEGWRKSLQELINTGKPFHFKQGLDVRLLDDAKAELLFAAKYDGDYIFAFDDFKDAPLIEEKIQLISRHIKSKKRVKFYVLCGYDRAGRYDENFWRRDLQELILRLRLIKRYGCLPYVMRFAKYQESPYRSLYIDLAAFGNQPQFFTKMPLAEFLEKRRPELQFPELAVQLQRLMEGSP